MAIGKIKAAEKRCRAAFAECPHAEYAWCCHHEMFFEKLIEPAGKRINYILSCKSKSEQVTRLNNFRPVRNLRKFKPASDAYDLAVKPASDAYDLAVKPASDAYDLAVKAASDAYDLAAKAASDAYDLAAKAASDAYDLAVKPAQKSLLKIYRNDVPLGTWNGESIFKK